MGGDTVGAAQWHTSSAMDCRILRCTEAFTWFCPPTSSELNLRPHTRLLLLFGSLPRQSGAQGSPNMLATCVSQSPGPTGAVIRRMPSVLSVCGHGRPSPWADPRD